MPLVHICHTSKVADTTLQEITPVICDAVARLLTRTNDTQDFEVTPKMVKVRFSPASPLDTNIPDIYIEVEARAFPARIERLDTYGAALCEQVSPFVNSDLSISVWFKLCLADWHSRPSPHS